MFKPLRITINPNSPLTNKSNDLYAILQTTYKSFDLYNTRSEEGKRAVMRGWYNAPKQRYEKLPPNYECDLSVLASWFKWVDVVSGDDEFVEQYLHEWRHRLWG